MKLSNYDKAIITSVCDQLVNLGLSDGYDYVAGGAEYCVDVFEIGFDDFFVLVGRDVDDANKFSIQAICDGEPVGDIIVLDTFNHNTLARAITAQLGVMFNSAFQNDWNGETATEAN
jgi:hypothetical protein